MSKKQILESPIFTAEILGELESLTKVSGCFSTLCRVLLISTEDEKKLRDKLRYTKRKRKDTQSAILGAHVVFKTGTTEMIFRTF